MIPKYSNLWVVAGIGAAGVIGTITYVELRRKFQKRYVKVGKVSKLLIYPVKAFAAQEVETAECTKSGLKAGMIRDRMWLVIDERGYHVDQKEAPRLVLLKTRLVGDQICIDGPGVDTLKLRVLDKIEDGAQIVKCKVFKTFIDAVDCGKEAANWIEQFLGKPGFRIVQHVQGLKHRPSDMLGVGKLKAEKYPVVFQSAQPFLVLSDASVEELNKRVQEKVSCLNIRPSIVVGGCQAFDEDKWKYIKIGRTATFVKTVASSKCTRITTNPETGDTNMEPLFALRKFRLATKPEERAVFKQSPLFGTFYGSEVEGTVSVGDDVYAVYE